MQQRKSELKKIAVELYSQPEDTDMESEPEDDVPSGWKFELKVQDYLQYKYISNVSQELQEPLMDHLEFFNVERRGCGRHGLEYSEQL